MRNKKQFYSRHMLYVTLIPSFISAIALALADVADAVVIGNRMGEMGLAAIGIVTPVYMIYNILGYGLSIGGEVIHARLAATGRDEEAVEHFNLVFWTGIFWAVIIAAAGLLFYERVLFVLGADRTEETLFRYCCQYYLPLVAAAPLFIANYIFYDLLRADDDQYLASAAFSIGCLFDLGLNILFVLVLGFGVTGAIWATIISQLINTGICSIHFFRKKGILRLTKPVISIRKCFPAFRTGVSSSIRYLFQFLFLATANNLLMKYAGASGSLYVAVFDVVMNVSYVAYALYEGAGAALQPLASAFYEEKDKLSLSYITRLALFWGVLSGTVVSALIAVFARQVVGLFGIVDEASLLVAIPAIRIFCISTPIAGVILILVNFYQSVDREQLAGLLTGFRTFMVLFPLTVLVGRFYTEHFWDIFPATEIGSVLLGALAIYLTKNFDVLEEVPVLSITLENDNHEIANLLEKTESFCEENGASMKQGNLLSMAVEEICMATIAKAFTGNKNEYIQVTLVAETDGKFTLLIRNSAQKFNPFDMRTERISDTEIEEEFMDSIGILVVKNKAEQFFYRRNKSFNVLTVVI
ncbi:MAG: polysaccharide biosynthesis C-terminal domain-containing protein [Blautia sp.]|nr:polysaccharide biosynthesis C-terminal domain-containing protein [Blautia sp.]